MIFKNRENISMGLLSLSTHTAGGGTRLAPGLQKVWSQFKRFKKMKKLAFIYHIE